MVRLLVHFVHGKLMHDFRVAEVISVSEMLGFKATPEQPRLQAEDGPFVYFDFPSIEAAVKIAARCIGICRIVEVWGEGKDYAEMRADWESRDKALYEPSYPRSFKCHVEGFGRSLTMEQQVERMEWLDYVPWTGPINLKKPEEVYCIFEDVGLLMPADAPPRRVYFGRSVAEGVRNLVYQFELRRRSYIGTTSMACELAFLVANQAHARPGSLVMDPFCGTASLLVSAAQFGATVFGFDLDPRVLKGNSEKSNLWSNFRQYSLPHPLDFLRCDMAQSAWRPVEILDAIVSDPPYGIRESAKKIGTVRDDVIIRDRSTHISSRVAYGVPEILRDLMSFAAKMLVVGGRLCFWVPSIIQDYTEADLPRHPLFDLVENSIQVLNTRMSRRLLTYRKHSPYNAEADFVEMKDDASASHRNFASKAYYDNQRMDMRHSDPSAHSESAAALAAARATRGKLGRAAQAAAAASSSDSIPEESPASSSSEHAESSVNNEVQG